TATGGGRIKAPREMISRAIPFSSNRGITPSFCSYEIPGAKPLRTFAGIALADRSDGDHVHVAVERQADDRHHLILDLYGNGDAHRVFVAQVGNHCAVQLRPVDPDNHLVAI